MSLGLERAGADLLFAVEKSDMAARTFKHNLVSDASDEEVWKAYLKKPIIEQARAKVIVRELGDVLESKDVLDYAKGANLDLVVGGPPCQGFSLAGRRDVKDLRNLLPWQFLNFVGITSPKAVVIENVVGMSHSFVEGEESSFSQLQRALSTTATEYADGYIVRGVLANALHYGAAQHRPRLLIIGIRADIASNHSELKELSKTCPEIWKSSFRTSSGIAPVNLLAPEPTVSGPYTLEDAISDLTKDRNSNPSKYLTEINNPSWPVDEKSDPQLKNHVGRKHREKTQERFKLYAHLRELGIAEKIVSDYARAEESGKEQVLSSALGKCTFPAFTKSGLQIAHDLDDLKNQIRRLGTRKHSQRVLAWDQPARTVLTLPDDYVHPLEPRTFTVRELARMQGFPDRYEFLGKETTGADRRKVEVPQYSQVGNAVSPFLAFSIGVMLQKLLGGEAIV